MRHLKYVVVLLFALSPCATLALAEVVAVVSTKSTLTTIKKNQVVDIFLGKSNRFPDGSQAVPIDQAETSSIRDEFYASLSGKSAAQMKAYWSKIIFTGRGQPPKEVPSNNDVKKFLAATPTAIGYIDKSTLDSTVKVLTVVP